ncbi:hypothetical protein IJG12_03305 [Candidatus Saccharibacteria bacterium]|nr:hypothetical protein [Candidatus Saccharibacteria bacterium]
MADTDTEKWALESKQIEAERQKAIQALEDEKPSKANLAFLDPKSTKVKGWSKDSDVVSADSERMGNRALILALSGVFLGIIGYFGSKANTGFGDIIISGLPSGLSSICLGIATILGMVVTGMELYWRIHQKKKLTLSFWTGLSAVLIVVIFFIVKTFLLSA